MGLIVKKDFDIGYDVISYMRISKFEYDFKLIKWNIQTDYYLSVDSVQTKKTIEYLKKWILDNPTKINDKVWDYLNKNYFNSDKPLNPIGQENIVIDSLFSPYDFNNTEEIFGVIYTQIKNNPSLIKAKAIISDVIENTEDIITPIIIEIEALQ
jgi:hypothetical protein